MKKNWVFSIMIFLTLAGSGAVYRVVHASDHDDGEMELKGRNLNLTDHFVFRKGDVTGVSADNSTLVFVQNSNPRSLARQQYFFSANARYEFHLSRVKTRSAAPTGSEDMTFRFNFSAPDANNIQTMTLNVLNGTNTVGSAAGTTTNLAYSTTGAITTNTGTIGGQAYKFFGGLREDTFFFDVERYFQVRYFLADRFLNANASASLPATCDGWCLGGGTSCVGYNGAAPADEQNPVNLFNPKRCAEDFTHLYNVNQIVMEVPIAALQANAETTFDTWSIITYQQ